MRNRIDLYLVFVAGENRFFALILFERMQLAQEKHATGDQHALYLRKNKPQIDDVFEYQVGARLRFGI